MFYLLNVKNAEMRKFTSEEDVLSAYLRLSAKDKLFNYILGLSDEPMDYPMIMEYLLSDYVKNR